MKFPLSLSVESFRITDDSFFSDGSPILMARDTRTTIRLTDSDGELVFVTTTFRELDPGWLIGIVRLVASGNELKDVPLDAIESGAVADLLKEARISE